MPFILDGLRVLDLSTTEAGGRATVFLADHGATVELVEPPGGSPLRRLAGWPSLGRGKSSRVVDLADDAGRAEIASLANDADVLVHTMRPTTAETLGLTYDLLGTENPRLVVASISGFGSVGPLRGRKGYEGIVLAKLGIYQGFHRATRRPGPTFAAVPYASYSAGQLAVQGVLGALLERERSGLGQDVETNLAHALATLDCWQWFLHLICERYPGAFTPRESFDEVGRPSAHQTMTLLVAATSDDRWLQFAQLQPHLFASLLKALDMEDLAAEPGWEGLPIYDSAEKRNAVWERMMEAVGRFSFAEWQAKFDEDPNVFAELFRSGTEVLDHPALADTDWVVTSSDPTVGCLRQLGRAVRVCDEDWEPPPAPALGSTGNVAATRPRWGSTARHNRPGSAPLEGVTILDLCVWYAAPYATSLLADLGARVIHVEPLEGDPIRMAAGFPEAGGLKVMQGKESLAVNLGTPEGRQVVQELAVRSSAVLHGFRRGVASKFGLDAETLRARNPNLVYVDATGYGTTGKCADFPSYAPSIAVAAGLTMRNVGPGSDEQFWSLPARKDRAMRLAAATSTPSINADGLSALGTANALLLGLLAASRGGAPRLETTMLSTVASVVYDAAMEYGGGELPRPDEELFGLSACYRLYESEDGWIFLAAPTDREWTALTEALEEHVALRDDPRFASAALRAQYDADLSRALADVFQTRPGAAWETELTARDVACAVAVDDSTEGLLMGGEFGGACGYVAQVTHPDFGEHPRLAPVIRFSRSATLARAAATRGQHTDELLRELGMTAEEIADLRARRIVS